MKPIIVTPGALREFAAGLSAEAIDTSMLLIRYERPEADYVISAQDSNNPQRVIIIRDWETGFLLPEAFDNVKRETLSRMATFVDRARTAPVRLPRHWSQYKHRNLISFFATPSDDGLASRWIVETTGGESPDIIFWKITDNTSTLALESFSPKRELDRIPARSDWDEVMITALRDRNDRLSALSTSRSEDITLRGSIGAGATKDLSFDQWMTRLSDDQRAFVDAPTDRSVRLRGPAGSGKTVALILKAMREATNPNNSDARIAVVTHSWAIAEQVDKSLSSMGLGFEHGIEITPLLEIAKSTSPAYIQGQSDDVQIWGEDSLSGKQAQLDQIVEVIIEFRESDWITYRDYVSESLRERLDSRNDVTVKALAWDLLVEFGSVIGAARIFPGPGSESKYFALARSSWMLPLENRDDKRVIFKLYERYMAVLEDLSLITTDQVLSDFLSYLTTHTWNRVRRSNGYDFLFVDEFHLFSPLERQVIHYLTRDTSDFPRVFMAVDPRQSPSESFIGVQSVSEVATGINATTGSESDDVENYDLHLVHRYTPEVLELVKNLHYQFPAYDLGGDWSVDLSQVSSAKQHGPVPVLITSGTQSAEEVGIYNEIKKYYSSSRIGVAVVDQKQWQRFSVMAARIGESKNFNVTSITGRSDMEGLAFRKRGVVVGPVEYLAGLQFSVVFVVGVPAMEENMLPNERMRLLSLLYLAISRSESVVQIFVNEEDGGAPEALERATASGCLTKRRGQEV